MFKSPSDTFHACLTSARMHWFNDALSTSKYAMPQRNQAPSDEQDQIPSLLFMIPQQSVTNTQNMLQVIQWKF